MWSYIPPRYFTLIEVPIEIAVCLAASYLFEGQIWTEDCQDGTYADGF